MGLADKRLYELKHSTSAAHQRVIPLDSRVPRENPQQTAERPKVSPSQTVPTSAGSAVPDSHPTEQRKWERVSLVGTKAHAILTDLGQKSAKVIDLSYGGVALSLEKIDEIPNQFNAVLHVPILPPVRVILRKAYTSRQDDGRIRLGCSFIS